jgi:excisionase family DNA binding protein
MNPEEKLHELNRGASAPFCHLATEAGGAPISVRSFSQTQKPMNPNESLLSKAAVMERLGVGEKTLRRLIRAGRLRVVKLGKTSPLKFRQLDVARFLESAVVTGAASAQPARF